jgi:MFS family permease
MLIGGIVLGLVLGLLAGGSFGKLARIHLRWVGILFAAVVVRFGTEALLNAGVEVVETFRMPLLLLGFLLLLIGLWVNRGYPGIVLAFVGILLNTIVITVNGGHMPIWAPSLRAAGFSEAEVTSALHVVVGGGLDVGFVVRALFIGDILPIPIPLIRNVASLGDLFLTFGLAFFLFASVVRTPTELDEEERAAVDRRLAALAASKRHPTRLGRLRGRSGLAPGLLESAALERPLVLGSPGTGLAAPALTPLPVPLGEAEAAAEAAAVAAETTAPPIALRVRRHPYVRLALNPSFSALWAGQLISLFGDRIHQMALAAVVLGATGSALASALVFVAATLPNLFFSPIAGALVDRWDRKEVLVVSDILRAAAVLLVPIAAVTNVYLVYPLVFMITTISIFFRPARVAILPQIVEEDELLTANSAMWVGETVADGIGYPLAGIFVVALGSALPLAFWLDAVTYLASAILLSTIVVGAPLRSRSNATTGADAASVREGGIVGELKEGWRFLRREPTLLANTVQATVAQLTVGVMIGLTPAYALTVFGGSPFGWEAVYSFVEASQSLGNLVGGFVIGLVGTRLAKGRMIISGYTVFGFLLFLFSMSGDLGIVLGLAFGSGIANMAFLIPSQTLFQERTPAELLGRVVGFRFSLVFGAMTLAMAVGGLLADSVGVTTVIAASGIVSMAAGLAGLAVPALRDA